MKSRLKRVPITPTELKDNYDSLGFSPAVLSGDLLFIGGQVGICLDGSVPTDPSKQMEQTFLNMESVLKAAGGTFDDVVDLTVFYTNYEAHGSLVRQI